MKLILIVNYNKRRLLFDKHYNNDLIHLLQINVLKTKEFEYAKLLTIMYFFQKYKAHILYLRENYSSQFCLFFHLPIVNTKNISIVNK